MLYTWTIVRPLVDLFHTVHPDLKERCNELGIKEDQAAATSNCCSLSMQHLAVPTRAGLPEAADFQYYLSHGSGRGVVVCYRLIFAPKSSDSLSML